MPGELQFRTLQLLESSGIDTERKLIELSPEEIVDLEGIAKEQIKQIYHFQRAAKRREFYSYMTGALNYGKANQKQKQAEPTVPKQEILELDTLADLRRFIKTMPENTVASIEIRVVLKNG